MGKMPTSIHFAGRALFYANTHNETKDDEETGLGAVLYRAFYN